MKFINKDWYFKFPYLMFDIWLFQDSMLDDDMGVGGAAAEDAEAEYIRKVCEKEIVTGIAYNRSIKIKSWNDL